MPPTTLENGAVISYQSMKLNVQTPISLIIGASQNHNNSTEDKSHMNCEEQPILTANVDRAQENNVCSSNSDKNLKSQQCLPLLAPIGNIVDKKSTTKENNVFSFYDLGNSITINDGNESIELMINSLTSVTNADEIQNNNKNLHRTKDICNINESDTSFNDTSPKDNAQYGKLIENIPNMLNPVEPTVVEKLATSKNNKGGSKYHNKSKCDADINDCQDINEMEPTRSRRKPTPCNNPLVSFTDVDKSNEILDKQPLKVLEVI